MAPPFRARAAPDKVTRWTSPRSPTTSLLVRSPAPARERLVASDPDAFYVTPAVEAHDKVLVHLPVVDADAVRRALTAAWELQR